MAEGRSRLRACYSMYVSGMQYQWHSQVTDDTRVMHTFVFFFFFLGRGGGGGGGEGDCGLGALLVNFCILEVHVAIQIRARSTGLH